jgi:hypothetical protein
MWRLNFEILLLEIWTFDLECCGNLHCLDVGCGFDDFLAFHQRAHDHTITTNTAIEQQQQTSSSSSSMSHSSNFLCYASSFAFAVYLRNFWGVFGCFGGCGWVRFTHCMGIDRLALLVCFSPVVFFFSGLRLALFVLCGW